MKFQIAEHAREDLGHCLPLIHVLEKRLPGYIVLLFYMRNEGAVLVEKHEDRAAQYGRRRIEPLVGGLTEEVCDASFFRKLHLEMIDDAAQEHGLSLPRVALDPEQLLVPVVAPLTKFRVIEQPDVTVAKQTALGLLDALLIEARVGDAQVGEI